MRNMVIVGGTGSWSKYHFVASPDHAHETKALSPRGSRVFIDLMKKRSIFLSIT